MNEKEWNNIIFQADKQHAVNETACSRSVCSYRLMLETVTPWGESERDQVSCESR